MAISQLYRNKRKENSITIPQETLSFFCKFIKGMMLLTRYYLGNDRQSSQNKKVLVIFTKFKKNKKNLSCDFYTIMLLIFLRIELCKISLVYNKI